MSTTKDGTEIFVGMKVWVDAWLAGLAWATVERLDVCGLVRVSFDWSGPTWFDVAPGDLFASEDAARAAYAARRGGE